MEKITVLVLMSIVFVVGLLGCGGVAQKEHDTLKAENEKLKEEIEEIKNGPQKLLNEARRLISEKDFISGIKEIETLANKHPGSTEAIESKKLLEQAIIGREQQRIAEQMQNEEREKSRIEEEKREKIRLANAMSKLRSEHDDMRNLTWYYDKSTPRYSNYNSLHLYMGKEGSSSPFLRFKIQYAADDWLFIESYVIKTVNDSYTISTSYGEVETDNGSGGIGEWYDVPLNSTLFNMVKDIISSNSVKIRHEGQQYYKDRTITSNEKRGLQNILDAYKAIGGTTYY